MLKTKSVHSPISPEDGLRILTSRFQGRGLRTSRYHVWMANLGPSESLLRRGQKQGNLEEWWPEFRKLYIEELFSPQALDRKNPHIKNHGQKFTLRLIRRLARTQNVTLMCHCAEDQKRCHRHLLREVILSKRI